MIGSPVQDRRIASSPHSEQLYLLSQYETGETGTLHRMYSDIMEKWLNYCCELGISTISLLRPFNYKTCLLLKPSILGIK